MIFITKIIVFKYIKYFFFDSLFKWFKHFGSEAEAHCAADISCMLSTITVSLAVQAVVPCRRTVHLPVHRVRAWRRAVLSHANPRPVLGRRISSVRVRGADCTRVPAWTFYHVPWPQAREHTHRPARPHQVNRLRVRQGDVAEVLLDQHLCRQYVIR